ncbi:MAG: hypothetical protein NDJ24_01190 [Alphaproteobacteria bacterium]|nr:hypothetical protein [Alphaproteobacteria bacterium]
MAKSGISKQHPATQHADSWTHHESQPLTQIEYNIYSFSNDDNPRACWQKCGSVSQPQSAIIHAQALFKSGQYKKVEIKQRYFDPQAQRNIDETWHVLEKNKRLSMPSSWTLMISGLMAILAFSLAYLLTL